MTLAVVLAAGTGSRLGGTAKALLSVPSGRSFLDEIMTSARAAGVTDFLVVIGRPHGQRVALEAGRLGAITCENPAPERGMASSVATGFAAAEKFAAKTALLWPVDIPLVRAETVRALLAESDPTAIVVPTFEARGGHPARIPRTVWTELAGCADLPEGARTVLRRHATIRLPVADPAILADVDTPKDLP